jgi:hypothetical protein
MQTQMPARQMRGELHNIGINQCYAGKDLGSLWRGG